MQKVQAFVNEANNVQSRRCEVMVALLTAQAGGRLLRRRRARRQLIADHCRPWQHYAAVEEDAREVATSKTPRRFGIRGPQPHLEWAAAQVGVQLFDPLPEEQKQPDGLPPFRPSPR